MTEIFNKKPQLKAKRSLRKQPILAERRLWRKLRNNQLGYKFRRQFGIGKYIIDFYCPRLRLVIEIDGATHSTDKEVRYDKIRQRYLEELGLTVKRYFNNSLRENMDYVLGDIRSVCVKLEKRAGK